jgi:colicin import membrane protein
MDAAAQRLEFAPPPTAGQLRALVLAVLVHGLLALMLAMGVRWHHSAPDTGVQAELWAAVPQEAAPPEPPPAPEPEPEPPPTPKPAPVQAEPPAPPQPSQADIALERERQHQKLLQERELERQQLQRLQAKKLEEARQQKQLELAKLEQQKQDKLRQAQQDKAKQAAEDKKREAQQAKQLDAMRQANLARMAGLAGGTGAPDAKGTATRAAGPSAGYAGRIRARVKPNIVFTEDTSGNPTAEVEVRTAPDGTIIGRRISQSSGNKDWDEAVLKALDKTEVLPRDVDGTVPAKLVLVFRPRDL